MIMSWRVSKAIVSLTAEVDASFPGRSKISDGTIGDAAHSARKSDHNPDDHGIVHARDFTEWDPNKNIDNDDVAYRLAEFLRAKKDPRIKYVISRGRIFFSYVYHGHAAWTWQPYHGPNGHFHHCHVSVYGDDGSPWGFNKSTAPPAKRWVEFTKGDTDLTISFRGGQVAEITQYQELLLWTSVKYGLPNLNPKGIDGKNGDNSAAAWINFQRWVQGMQRKLGHSVWPSADNLVTSKKLDVLRFWAAGK